MGAPRVAVGSSSARCGRCAAARLGSRRSSAGSVPPAAGRRSVAAAGGCTAWHTGGWARCEASPAAAYDERGRPSDELMREVQQWIARRRSTGNSQGAEEWVARVEKAAAKSLRGKRVLVFVNPECGAKQAKQHSEDIVRPMLAALGCLSVEFSETDAKNSAMELLHTADVSELDAVCRAPAPAARTQRCLAARTGAPDTPGLSVAASSGVGAGRQRHGERSRAGSLLCLAGAC